MAVALLALALPCAAQSVDELKRQIEERDAKIRELSERLNARQGPSADDEIGRAMERLLVQQGALVLPARAYELDPRVAYAHWDRDRGPLRYTWEASVTARAGIGWRSQVELRVPYTHVATTTDSATDWGDVSATFVREFAREDGSWPGLFGAFTWLENTGADASAGGVPTGGGFDVPQVSLTAVKRHDPLVSFGTLSYAVPRGRHVSGVEVQPGNATGLRLGTALAATPYTSMNLGLNLALLGAARADGQRIADSDDVLGTLEVGFATVLTRRALLNIGGEFRVSGAVPNFRLFFGLPIRF
jgi:hypothetical protein